MTDRDPNPQAPDPSARPRMKFRWLILLIVWSIGLVIWLLYLAVLGYLLLHIL